MSRTEGRRGKATLRKKYGSVIWSSASRFPQNIHHISIYIGNNIVKTHNPPSLSPSVSNTPRELMSTPYEPYSLMKINFGTWSKFVLKGTLMDRKDYSADFPHSPLKHAQNDMHLALSGTRRQGVMAMGSEGLGTSHRKFWYPSACSRPFNCMLRTTLVPNEWASLEIWWTPRPWFVMDTP